MKSIHKDFEKLRGMRPRIEKNFQASFKDFAKILGSVDGRIKTEKLEKERLSR